MQLEAIASHPITSYLGEETNTCLTTISFQAVIESNKVPLQPPLLQAKQPQLPQWERIKKMESDSSLWCPVTEQKAMGAD